MKKNGTLFGIALAVISFSILASPLDAMAGPARGTTTTLPTAFSQPRKNPSNPREAFVRPYAFRKCAFGYKALPLSEDASDLYGPGNKLYYFQEGEGHEQPIYIPMSFVHCESDPQRFECSLPIVTITGVYVCRLDDFPTADVCPEGSELWRWSMAAHQCRLRYDIPNVPEDTLAGVSCLPGFHKESPVDHNHPSILSCVMDGTSWEQELSELRRKICTGPKTRAVGGGLGAQFPGVEGKSTETYCATLSQD